jgi:hypothetical protein
VGWRCWWRAEPLHPRFASLDGLLSEGAGALFHCEISLGQGPSHLGVADTLGSGDEQADPTPTTSRPTPPFHAAVQCSSHVASVGQRAARDKLGEGGLDVEATGIGFSESRQERTVTCPGSHSSENCQRSSYSPPPSVEGIHPPGSLFH